MKKSYLSKLGAALALSATVATTAPAKAETEVTIGWPTSTSITAAVLFFGQDLGYFKKEGINFKILNFRGSATVVPQVIAKRVTVAFPNPDILLVSQQPGKEALPVKFFYNMTRSSIWEFIVPAESKVKTVADLKGSTIGIGALQWGNVPMTRSMLSDAGLKEKTDYEFLPVGLGGAAFLAFKKGDVSALNLFDTQHAQLAASGTAIRHLKLPSKFTNLFSNGFIAHEDTIANDPELLTGFGRAVAKSTVACGANYVACVKAFWAAVPERKPKNANDPAVLAQQIDILKARFSKYLSFSNERKFGSYDPAVWTDFINVLHAGGQLSTTNIDAANVYTNDLVKGINSFDTADVVAQAKAAN